MVKSFSSYVICPLPPIPAFPHTGGKGLQPSPGASAIENCIALASGEQGEPDPYGDEANHASIDIAQHARRHLAVTPLTAQSPQTRAKHHGEGHQEGHLPGEQLTHKTSEGAEHGDDQTAADGDANWHLEHIDQQGDKEKIPGSQEADD